MNARDLAEHLSAYAAGLEAELALLRQVQQLAADQREAGTANDSDRLQQIADERTRLMANLVTIEHEIRGARQHLSEHRAIASRLKGFDEVAARHRVASTLVTRILASDEETMAALRQAEIARREAAHAIEAGETTLAAYRRVLTPVVVGPSLVDERG